MEGAVVPEALSLHNRFSQFFNEFFLRLGVDASQMPLIPFPIHDHIFPWALIIAYISKYDLPIFQKKIKKRVIFCISIGYAVFFEELWAHPKDILKKIGPTKPDRYALYAGFNRSKIFYTVCVENLFLDISLRIFKVLSRTTLAISGACNSLGRVYLTPF